jgi:hypothetical protein
MAFVCSKTEFLCLFWKINYDIFNQFYSENIGKMTANLPPIEVVTLVEEAEVAIEAQAEIAETGLDEVGSIDLRDLDMIVTMITVIEFAQEMTVMATEEIQAITTDLDLQEEEIWVVAWLALVEADQEQDLEEDTTKTEDLQGTTREDLMTKTEVTTTEEMIGTTMMAHQ